MSILVTGGLGFIGSHTVVEFLEKTNKDIVIVDNLSNSKVIVLDKIKEITKKENIFFYQVDLMDQHELREVFTRHNLKSVIHFAGLKAVNESIKKPLWYYNNNIMMTINLLNLMKEFNCKNMIFSSSATVYGNAPEPMIETSQIGVGIKNPYGQTKYMIEMILKDFQYAYPSFNITCLRYFNPVGAHPSGLIGEDPNGIPNNLMPYILNVACRKYDILSIFGDDYNTSDGTCIRDFIHVVDLANAHLLANNELDETTGSFNVYNVGTGKGTSVMELVNVFEKVNNVPVPFKLTERREGDRDIVYCNNDLIANKLGWKPIYDIKDMCKHSWNFVEKKEFK